MGPKVRDGAGAAPRRCSRVAGGGEGRVGAPRFHTELRTGSPAGSECSGVRGGCAVYRCVCRCVSPCLSLPGVLQPHGVSGPVSPAPMGTLHTPRPGSCLTGSPRRPLTVSVLVPVLVPMTPPSHRPPPAPIPAAPAPIPAVPAPVPMPVPLARPELRLHPDPASAVFMFPGASQSLRCCTPAAGAPDTHRFPVAGVAGACCPPPCPCRFPCPSPPVPLPLAAGSRCGCPPFPPISRFFPGLAARYSTPCRCR